MPTPSPHEAQPRDDGSTVLEEGTFEVTVRIDAQPGGKAFQGTQHIKADHFEVSEVERLD